LSKAHTGRYLAEQLAACLEEFGITEKVNTVYMSFYRLFIMDYQVFRLVLDNASNNDTMVDELQVLLPNSICGADTWVRCICHVMNLTVKVRLDCLLEYTVSNSFEGHSLTIYSEEESFR
jgi:hypothetical protein